MEILLSNSSDEPIYEQITSQIKAMIMKGSLKSGDTLPSMRKLAKELHVSVMSRPRQHRHLKRKNSILFLVFLDFPHFFIHSGWQDTLF